jgi:hypothetical protein
MTVKIASLFSTVAVLGVLELLSSGTVRAQTPPRLYRTYGQKASEVYKNIQVLKDIDSTELIPVMQYMAESLGVGCDFCHVATGSDKDDKAMKVKARKMIRMTREINKNHFDGEMSVSCTVCHRGSELPAFALTIPDERSTRTTTTQSSTSLPTADQILDKYLQAVGGAGALQRISSRVEKGISISGDRKFPHEIYSQAPDKRISITHQPDGDAMTGFNGTSAWIEITAPNPPGRDLTPSETAAARLDADLKFALNARRVLGGAKVLAAETIDGKPMYVVSGKPETMKPMRLYFDQQTGLLARVLRYSEVPLGFTPVQMDYSDYREVDGVKIPFRRTTSRPSGRSTVQIETVEQNVAIEAARFKRPATAASREDAKNR